MDVLDEALAAVLGTAAPALRENGAQRRISYHLDRLLTHGRSGALVAFVYETDLRSRVTQKLLLKLDSFPEGTQASEFQRQRAALDEAPPEFARRHLTELAAEGHDLVRVGDGRWIVFQRLATVQADDPAEAARLDELDVLTKSLAALRSGGPVQATGRELTDVVDFAPEAFVAACGQIVHSVLREWALAPVGSPMSVAAYLEMMLRGRRDEGRPLHTLAQRLPTPAIRFDAHREALPNPLVFLTSTHVTGNLTVQALVGRCHGDLHTGNILVPVRNLASPTPFRLVDLDKYQSEGPLARDPVGLLLYVVVRALRDDAGIADGAGTALIDVLVDPDSRRGALLPHWLSALVTSVRTIGETYANDAGLLSEWRAQWHLSLVGCALRMIGRATTPLPHRLWLFRLAAEATQAFVGSSLTLETEGAADVGHETFAELVKRPEPGPGSTWVAALCSYLPFMGPQARAQGYGAAVEELVAAASRGEERTDRFVELVRILGGPTDNLRAPTDDETPVDVVYTCPQVPACDLVRSPAPDHSPPQCWLRPGMMRREFW